MRERVPPACGGAGWIESELRQVKKEPGNVERPESQIIHQKLSLEHNRGRVERSRGAKSNTGRENYRGGGFIRTGAAQSENRRYRG